MFLTTGMMWAINRVSDLVRINSPSTVINIEYGSQWPSIVALVLTAVGSALSVLGLLLICGRLRRRCARAPCSMLDRITGFFGRGIGCFYSLFSKRLRKNQLKEKEKFANLQLQGIKASDSGAKSHAVKMDTLVLHCPGKKELNVLSSPPPAAEKLASLVAQSVEIHDQNGNCRCERDSESMKAIKKQLRVTFATPPLPPAPPASCSGDHNCAKVDRPVQPPPPCPATSQTKKKTPPAPPPKPKLLLRPPLLPKPKLLASQKARPNTLFLYQSGVVVTPSSPPQPRAEEERMLFLPRHETLSHPPQMKSVV